MEEEVSLNELALVEIVWNMETNGHTVQNTTIGYVLEDGEDELLLTNYIVGSTEISGTFFSIEKDSIVELEILGSHFYESAMLH